MSDAHPDRPAALPALAWLLAGLALLVGAWLIPVNLGALTPALLAAAGRDTPSVAASGRDWLAAEKPGPAGLFLAAAQAVGDPGAGALATELAREAARAPELIAWGGWDPFLDPLFRRDDTRGRTASTPVLTFFIATDTRNALRGFLEGSRSQGVQALLRTRTIDRTSHFVPAARPGGQSLDAVILLTALLYQGEHFSGSLQRELRGLADEANTAGELGALELFYLDLLSLGQRLDWIQLSELLRRTDSTKTAGEFAHLGRVEPEQLPVIYSAALLSGSADRVAGYLLRFGRTGLDDLRAALREGRGAVNQLLARQVPVNRTSAPAIGAMAELGLLHPRTTLAVKYLGFLLGAFGLFRGLERQFLARPGGPRLPRLSAGTLALFTAALLIIGTEPFLLKADPVSEYRLRVTLPVLASLSESAPSPPESNPVTMDTSTLVSIAFFAALQVGMYFICLMKINEIARQNLPPLIKLKLMENEENLFDGGLYIGIGGTASALVLQVLGIIEPNLLAAYSSNLFGITCVALVKIRHVRPFKNRLILESQAAAVAPVPAGVAQ